jgi:hypothetical protein
MAKISNTTSYPNAAAAADDYVIGTDVSDNNNTKNFTLQEIANLAPGEVEGAVYSTGTWTPIAFVSGSATAPVYTSAGYYVQTGNKVSAFFEITVTTAATGYAIARVAGLPLNASQGNGARGTVSIASTSPTSATNQFVGGRADATSFRLFTFKNLTSFPLSMEYVDGLWSGAPVPFSVQGVLEYYTII